MQKDIYAEKFNKLIGAWPGQDGGSICPKKINVNLATLMVGKEHSVPLLILSY